MRRGLNGICSLRNAALILALLSLHSCNSKDKPSDRSAKNGEAVVSTAMGFAAEAPNAAMGGVRAVAMAEGVRAIDMGGTEQGIRAGRRAGQEQGVRAGQQEGVRASTLRQAQGDPSTGLRVSGKDSARGEPSRTTKGARRQSADEQPISGVRARLDGTSFETVSNKEGKFRLDFIPPGDYTLVTEKQGESGEVYAASSQVTITAGNVADLGTLSLLETGSITGTAVRQGAKSNLGTDVFIPGTSFVAKTDDAGKFTILYIPTGDYEIAAMYPGFGVQKKGGVVVNPKEVTEIGSLVLAPLPPDTGTGTIGGTVSEVEGGPVRGASILTIPGDFKAVTDGSGAFKIEKLPAGAYMVVVSAKGFMGRSKAVSLDEGKTAKVDVALTPVSAVSTGKPNNPPTVNLSGPPSAAPGSAVEMTAEVSDDDENAVLFLQWKANGGSFDKTWAETVNWTAPAANGIYIISVRVTDGLATDTASTIIMVTTGESLAIDIIPPDTDLTKAPCDKGKTNCFTKSGSASFEFASNEPRAGFLCTLDQSPKQPCSSPKTYDSLSNAEHFFQVQAIDAAGNIDFSPAGYSWTVDGSPPTAGQLTTSNKAAGSFVATSFVLTGTFADEGTGLDKCEACEATDGACDSEWAAASLVSGTCTATLNCTDGQSLKLSMRAFDKGGTAGADSSVDRICDGGIDPVGTIAVSGSTSTHVPGSFTLSALVSDSKSGLASCEQCVSSDGTCDGEWKGTTLSSGTCSATTLTCTNGQSLTLSIRATDNLGNVGSGTAVTRTCDAAGPTAGSVNDGTGTDIAVQISTTTISANWTGFADAAGVASYEYSIGTSPGSVSIKGWTANGAITSVSTSGLSLTNDTTYYVNVRATDSVGNVGGVASSNGVFVDAGAPSFSGLTSATATSAAQIGLSWTAAIDNSSTAANITYDICQTTNSGGCSAFAATYTSEPGATSYGVAALSAGTRYYFVVRAKDESGNEETNTLERSATTWSTGIIQAVTGGEQHSCALAADGTVRCWGLNNSGQLGNGTATSKTTPVSVSTLTGAVAVKAGYSHTCALVYGGTVRCWGYNWDGELGDGTTSGASTTPVTVSTLTGAVAVTAGQYHTCALVHDGTVRCWGMNQWGRLGDGTTTNKTTPVAVSTLSSAIAVTAGGSHTCALAANGTVKCWGVNGNGQLGDGTTANSTLPIAVSTLSDAIAVTAGSAHTCALTADGTVRCWGKNLSGQLGDGTTGEDKTTPVSVSTLTGAIEVTAGGDDPGGYTCALVVEGTVKCWGRNNYGQLGDGTTTNKTTPVAVSALTGAISVTGGQYHTCALAADGTVKCWGRNSIGQLGDGTTTPKMTPVVVSMPSRPIGVRLPRLSEGIASRAPIQSSRNGLVGGDYHTCALLSNGTVRCWGSNWDGELGDGTLAWRATPVAVSTLTDAVAITEGGNHTCAVVLDGTAVCWGRNSYGQLGDGTTTNKTTPVAVSTLTGAIAVTAGGALAVGGHTCAVVSNGTVRCWGYNGCGGLGDGTTTNKTTPVVVSTLTGAVAVTARSYHTCALTTDGTIKCWGCNGNGQLGDGTTASKSTPVAVSTLTGAIAIAAGGYHTCALTTDGTIKCWGRNAYGRLGDGTTADKTIPVAVSTLTGAIAVTVGGTGVGGYSCAVVSDGTVKCWGFNSYGGLGDGTTTDKATPVAVSTLTGALAVSGGQYHACALLADGSAKCWGSNSSGQLGDGTTIDRLTPVPVTNLP